jgi:DNA polymerase-3 subunit epsilon
MTKELWRRFDRIVIFDTETTGIDFDTDRIIELGGVAIEERGEVDSLNCLIRLPEGKTLPPFIVDLTGITDEELAQNGVSEETAAEGFCRLLEGAERPLLVAYNAQFDLCFVYYFLAAHGLAAVLKKAKMLDALTVYKDRRPYPHKLFHAIEAYGVEAENTHRAIDDTKAAWEVLCAMERECADLEQYINLFGYNPKFGVSGPKISSIRYVAQPYRMTGKLYEQ